MKRQGDKSASQPAVKKSDGNMSTDLRSKIGAKLQTLLNGFTPDKRLFPRSRRQLYADLFGETQHSQIIIDPTIVIKSEPDTEESSDDTTSLNSENFLLSAKTRITALLNKQESANKFPFKNKEKENSFSSKEYSPTSSSKRPNHSHSQTRSQSCLNNTLNKRRKLSCSRGDSSEPAINQVRLKKLSVVVEDIMNSKSKTKYNRLLPTQHVENKNCSENVESNPGYFSPISEHNMATKDYATDEVPEPFVSSDDVECIIDDSGTINQLGADPHLSTDEYNSNEINPQLYPLTSESSEIGETSGSLLVDDSDQTPIVIPFGDILLEKTSNQFSSIADDSELVDDPNTDHSVMDITSDSVMTESIHEPEVVLLCVKKPTHEVITLEDDNDSEDIIEEVHECVQCGKAFRAKSLLNFHIRMHGSDSSPSSSS